MNQMTLALIHRAYQESVKKSDNILDIVKNLYEILSEETVVEEDSASFEAFVDALRECYSQREQTFELTNAVIYLNNYIMFIILWLNSTYGLHIDIDLYARRKGLESDLTKMLRKSITQDSNLSVNILDRFGLRFIINNNCAEEENIKNLYRILDSVSAILANKNRKTRKDFIDWLNQSKINRLDKAVIYELLNTPFSITHKRDYVKNKKENGYQSIHFTVVFNQYSDVLPGYSLEVQLRTKRMDKIAESGSASHERYKQYNDESVEDENPVTKVFVIDDLSNITKNPRLGLEEDSDGINHSKNFLNRSLSTTLVPKL